MAILLRKIPIGAKIFGIALGMLGLLIVTIYISYIRLQKVKAEIVNLAQYIVPITDLIAITDVHSLEQELNFERVLKFYQVAPPNSQQINIQQAEFERRGEQVDQELDQAISLVKAAIANTSDPEIQQEFTKLEPMLRQIEKEHQDFHDLSVQVFNLLAADQKAEAHPLEEKIAAQEEHFNRQLEQILLELEKFTIRSAQAGQRHQQGVLQLGLAVAALATVLGLISASIVTAGLVQPTRRLMTSMKAVKEGNLDIHIESSSEDEIGLLATSFNHMVNELKQKQQIKETFGKYVDPRVVENLMGQSNGANTGGEKQVMTVFFSDVAGFADFAHHFTPDRLVQVTNQYLTLMSAPVSDNGGVIDKFIDTMVMGFWGPPFTSETDHAKLACDAALDQIARLDQLYQLMSEVGGTEVELAKVHLYIGLATGSLVVGNMGSESSKSYTVMGDTVNTASRLKGASKQYGTQVMMTEDTQKLVTGAMETREIDLIKVVGKEEPVRVYELLGRTGELDPGAIALRDAFQLGLSAYRDQNWDRAKSDFETCLKIKPDDGPAKVYLQRMQELQNNPPPADWDGVWNLTKK